jgi:transketolase
MIDIDNIHFIYANIFHYNLSISGWEMRCVAQLSICLLISGKKGCWVMKMYTNDKALDQLAVNSIRMLAVDAVEQAGAGHPGLPMGAAPMGYALWVRQMKHNPANPEWFNRDRFVLSAGHGSMLLYSLLHLCGYALPLEQLRRFRQWGSLTPGHPEVGHTPGVDATTGPLGQGLAMAVGMAMTEAHLGAAYNREHYPVVDHHTFALCSDGDMMEGVVGEAASLAGHLRLGKLIVLYDSNDISLDGRLILAFSENVQLRFESYGWQVLRVEDGNDLAAISGAIERAKADPTRPSLIEIRTIIGYGSPNKAGKGGPDGPHGTPLGAEEARLAKMALNWPLEPEFYVPDPVRRLFSEVGRAGLAANCRWDELFHRYRAAYPQLARQLEAAIGGDLPDGWDAELRLEPSGRAEISTRIASGEAINRIAAAYSGLFGGSADLETSTYTHLKGGGKFTSSDYRGRNVNFGVREFAMAAAVNGMTLHGGVRAFGSTFLVFSDYLRPALRLGAIMQAPGIFVLTHDSIFVGEDGPTHQPIEQLASLRAMPNVTVIRPADGYETIEAWRVAMTHKGGPVCMVLSRQPLPLLKGTKCGAEEGVARGAYVVSEAADGCPAAILLATGSEVVLAVEAQERLSADGVQVRVVSIPSWELFERQPQDYRDRILPPDVQIRLAVEMASPFGWERYVGERGGVVGIGRFGASGKGAEVAEAYGFSVEKVEAALKALL